MDLQIRGKQFYLMAEDGNLAPYAQRNRGEAILRVDSNDPDSDPALEGERTPFQLDRDKIIHSRAIRRLMRKTQVLSISKGDHFRTRLTHVLEVSQIARSLAKLLGLNEELTEAIALGHDLGHTPFGHVGERTLHRIISGELLKSEGIPNFGGFKHNFQSVHIVDNLEQWSVDGTGFNLTLAVRDGILKHTKLKYDKKDDVVQYPELKLLSLESDVPFTLEGQLVKLADDIAQTTHDLEDGFRLGIINIEHFVKLPIMEKVCKKVHIKTSNLKYFDARQIRGYLIGPLVGLFIHDCALATIENIKKQFSSGLYPAKYDNMIACLSQEVDNDRKNIADIIDELFVTSLEVSTMDGRAEYLVKNLFLAYHR